MKFIATIFLLALILSPSFAVQHKTFSVASQRQIEKIKAQKGTWASFLVNLAEVHLSTGGPLDELIETIEEVVEDLQNKLQRAHEAFDQRTLDHEEEVSRINALIDSAASDIAETTENLQLLNGLRLSLIQEIANIEQAIATNQQLTEEAIALRERQNAEFEAKVPEHNEAVAAIDEALEVLSQLVNDGSSFVQVKKLKRNVEVLNQKLKGQDKAFLNALMQLASSNEFADQDAIKRVVNLMNEVKNNLLSSLAQLTEQENQQVAAHKEDLDNKAKELQSLTVELANTQTLLADTEVRIVDNEAFLAQRIQDKADREQDLQDENDLYEEDTKRYEDLVAQFNQELNACSLALEHLNSSEIAGYIGNRMEMDTIIDTQHGSGITVEKNPLDLE